MALPEATAGRVSQAALVARKRLALARPDRLMVRLRRRATVRLAHRWLGGMRGIEIGGSAQNDFGLDVLNVDRYGETDTVYKEAEREVWGKARPVDVVARGDDLPFADDSQDFVLASHVIEHIPDPIAALREWVRVARRYVFLIVPHRDRTFDRDRPITPLVELVERHQAGLQSDEDQHWTVWVGESFLELCRHLGLTVVDYRDPDRRGGNGFVVVIDASASKEPGS